MSWQTTFKALQPGHDPRHIEAYVRVEHGTIDHLSAESLRAEARIAADCVVQGGVAAAEDLARGYGL